jgi:lantibiotic leader peptide-processing serine protease
LLRLSHLTRALLLVFLVAGVLATAAAADAARYLVVYRAHDVPRHAPREIERAGGTLVWSYDRIGVVLADSDDPTFLDRLDREGRHRLHSSMSFDGSDDLDFDDHLRRHRRSGRLPNEPATDADTFSVQQWDMQRINAPAAHAITGGNPAVLAADIDTGIDYNHPELRDNLSLEDSASCVGGVPDQAADPATGRLPFFDTSGHGTHTAGTIAAADNGIGIVGVAPNVRLAAVKVVDSAGKIYPEAVVCGYMWAATHGVSVANTSLSIDKRVLDPARPERDRFYCLDDPAERTILTAVHRAARYAMKKGVTLVASAGNNNTDLANPPAGNGCLRLPVELPGVIGVSSTTRNGQLTYHSNHGLGVVDVAAPGGDSAEQAPPSGLVLSTLPTSIPPRPPVILGDGGGIFGYAFGTSQAAPHVTGVAALVISLYGDDSPQRHGRMHPWKVERILQATAEPMACPPNPYTRTVGAVTYTATCAVSGDVNGFFGHGEVDALAAVSLHVPGSSSRDD